MLAILLPASTVRTGCSQVRIESQSVRHQTQALPSSKSRRLTVHHAGSAIVNKQLLNTFNQTFTVPNVLVTWIVFSMQIASYLSRVFA